MNKSKLQVGKKYLHIRKTVIDGVEREAERWMRCEKITIPGAIFSRDLEPEIYLTNDEIEGELYVHGNRL